jgi:nicotinamidase-related amidase
MPRPRSSAKSCLLIIDMINEFKFEGVGRSLPAIERTARRIARLKRRMKESRSPVVYVNDNFGKWQSDFRKLVTRCLDEQCLGRNTVRTLLPEDDDYFVLKPKHSGFYATPLELLLRYLNADRIILTGIAGDNCVFFTAADAYMREFKIAVPADCVVSPSGESNRSALEHMRLALKADIRPSSQIVRRRAAS